MHHRIVRLISGHWRVMPRRLIPIVPFGVVAVAPEFAEETHHAVPVRLGGSWRESHTQQQDYHCSLNGTQHH